MSSTTSLTLASAPPSGWRRGLRAVQRILRRQPMAALGVIVILLWVGLAIFAPQIAPFDVLAQNVDSRLQPPSATHLWGTDELGRDIFSRVIHGGRITIPAGLVVVVTGSLLGVLVGAVSGYLGGLWDEALMRVAELFMAFPTIILAMAITAALGPDIRNAIIALVIVWWPSFARLLRGLVLKQKSSDYVEAARSIGAKNGYILFRSILPNTVGPAIVLTTLDVGNAILTFAGLSFLGLGPDPTSPEWGRMISVGIDYFDQWWTWLFPGIAIATLVIAFNFIGDGLADFVDVKTRR